MRASVLLVFVHLMKLRGYRCLFFASFLIMSSGECAGYEAGADAGRGAGICVRSSAGVSMFRDFTPVLASILELVTARECAEASVQMLVLREYWVLVCGGAGAGPGAGAGSEADVSAEIVLINPGFILIASARITTRNCCQYTVFTNFEGFNKYRCLNNYSRI